MKASDPRLLRLASEARVRPPHVFHTLAAISEDPRAFDPASFAIFTGLETRHVQAIVAVLEAAELLPTRKPREKVEVGCRLSRGFELPDDWLAFAQDERRWDGRTVDAEFGMFCDYWRAAPGSKGVKLDWLATWRNWVRRSHTPEGSWRPNRGPVVMRLVETPPADISEDACTPEQARDIIKEFGLRRNPIAIAEKAARDA